ncbi:MAG: ABC transporter ATP-binding protein [Acidimicrobiia bacterium]
MADPASASRHEPDRDSVVRTECLTKRYGHTTALDELELEIRAGEVFGYLGPNGAGKSTTIALLLGLIRPSSGTAHVFGLDAWRDAPTIHRRVAYVPSEADLWPSLTGAETMRFLASVHGSVDEAYRDELVERFDLVPDTKIRAYSHGNRQKVVLIAALATRADLLLLDEPTAGLDPLMEQVFRECVREARERGQTVLLSSHILSEVDAVCDRVAMLRAGRIIETGRLDVLRGLAAVHVHAVVTGTVPDLRGVDGLSNVAVRDDTVECDVTGSMEPLLSVLGQAGLSRITTREPSLEELFVSRYGDGPEQGTRA